jgi:hypothetical protein
MPFFEKRFGVTSDYWPNLADITKSKSIDVELAASGFSKQQAEEFEKIQDELANEEEESSSVTEDEEISNEEPIIDNTQYDINEESIIFTNDEKTEERTQEIQQQEIMAEAKKLHMEPDENLEEKEEYDEQTVNGYKKKKKKILIDHEDIKNKVRRSLQKKQTRQENIMKAAKRNVQKGKEKRKIKNAMGDGW